MSGVDADGGACKRADVEKRTGTPLCRTADAGTLTDAGSGSGSGSGSDSVAALLARAQSLAGFTLGELGERVGVEVPSESKRGKGVAGHIVELALGASAGSKPVPDFPDLGVELKTIPINDKGRPSESTFVCTIALNEIGDTDFEHSRVCHKLERVLFVPVQAASRTPLPDRRIGTPLLWTPSAEERHVLQQDYEQLAILIADGAFDRIDARLGTALQVRPKGPNSHARRRAPSSEGAICQTLPLGFYLRASFTHRALFGEP